MGRLQLLHSGTQKGLQLGRVRGRERERGEESMLSILIWSHKDKMHWQINMCSMVAAPWELASLSVYWEDFALCVLWLHFNHRPLLSVATVSLWHLTPGPHLTSWKKKKHSEYLNKIGCEICLDKSLQESAGLNISHPVSPRLAHGGRGRSDKGYSEEWLDKKES